MNPITLMAEISRKIVATFSEIEEICRTYEGASNTADKTSKPEKKTDKQDRTDKNDKADKSGAKNTSAKKKESQTPVKPKQPQKKKVLQPESESRHSSEVSENEVLQQKHEDKKKANPYSDAPRKPMGSYLLYLQERKPKVQTIFPNLSLTQISQVVGKQWQTLSKQQKDSFTKRFNDAKAKYKLQLKEYKKIHPDYDENEKQKKKKLKASKNNAKKTSKVSVSDEESEDNKEHHGSLNNQNQNQDSMGSV